MKKTIFLSAVLFLLQAGAEAPLLVGDGVHDDTAAIQAMLDRGTSLVTLPAPRKEYVISRPLLLGDGQELRLGRFSRIRLADGSNCRMLSNRDPIRGNRDIAVVGGVWDMNNLGHRVDVFSPLVSDPGRDGLHCDIRLPSAWRKTRPCSGYGVAGRRASPVRRGDDVRVESS